MFFFLRAKKKLLKEKKSFWRKKSFFFNSFQLCFVKAKMSTVHSHCTIKWIPESFSLSLYVLLTLSLFSLSISITPSFAFKIEILFYSIFGIIIFSFRLSNSPPPPLHLFHTIFFWYFLWKSVCMRISFGYDTVPAATFYRTIIMPSTLCYDVCCSQTKRR